MDENTIEKIAAEIAKHLPATSWSVLAIQVLLIAIAAAIGVYFGEYLKERGKNLATKADFESLTAQLHANTELVETIKSEVSQKDWAQREWANTRRIKLEELLIGLNDCDHFRDVVRGQAFAAQDVTERDPASTVDMIAKLYFPELVGVVARYLADHNFFLAASRQIIVDQLSAGDDWSKRKAVCDAYIASLPAYNDKFILTTEQVRESAHQLVLKIAAVPK